MLDLFDNEKFIAVSIARYQGIKYQGINRGVYSEYYSLKCIKELSRPR